MDEPLVVLQSFPAPRATTNPYIVMLAERLQAEPGVQVMTFSWSSALFGRYHVLHLHWPENLVSGGTAAGAAARQVLFLLLLLRLALTRRAVVRTLHNLTPPSGLSRRQRWLLEWVDRRVTLRIRLNRATPIPAGHPHATILHGSYRDWFAKVPHGPHVPGRLLLFGLIRRYKGTDALVDAFTDTAGQLPALSLRVVGRPTSTELAHRLRDAARRDDRISLVLTFLSDQALVSEIDAAELVVLPYPHMHNSGTVLAALSLNRPVLVPDNEVNRELAREVGRGWVFRFPGELSGADLLKTVRELRAHPPATPPALGARHWADAAADHVQAYRRAIALRTRPG